MNIKFTRTKPIVLLTGVVMVVLGIAVLLNPISAIEMVVRLVGWVLVAYGVLTLVPVFMNGGPAAGISADFVMGVIAFVAGLIMGIFPGPLVTIAWSIIGIMIALTGVLDIAEAGESRRTGSPLGMPATVSGIITLVFGLLVTFLPIASAGIAMMFAAVALIVDGVTEIIFGLSM